MLGAAGPPLEWPSARPVSVPLPVMGTWLLPAWLLPVNLMHQKPLLQLLIAEFSWHLQWTKGRRSPLVTCSRQRFWEQLCWRENSAVKCTLSGSVWEGRKLLCRSYTFCCAVLPTPPGFKIDMAGFESTARQCQENFHVCVFVSGTHGCRNHSHLQCNHSTSGLGLLCEEYSICLRL